MRGIGSVVKQGEEERAALHGVNHDARADGVTTGICAFNGRHTRHRAFLHNRLSLSLAPADKRDISKSNPEQMPKACLDDCPLPILTTPSVMAIGSSPFR